MRVLTLSRTAVVLALLLSSAGCATSGRDFHADPLTQLVPGHTTLPRAAAMLQAHPVQTYVATDGSFEALWSYHVTSLNHLLYRKSALLRFGADGTFERVVDTSGFVRDAAQHRDQLERAQQACATSAAVCP
jgi:hypothetical protein